GTRTPVRPRVRCGNFASPLQIGRVLPSRMVPAAPRKPRREILWSMITPVLLAVSRPENPIRRATKKPAFASTSGILLRPRTPSRPSLLVPFIRDIHPANHHFFPRLIPPADGRGGIRIVGVLGRVIEMGDAFQHGSLGHGNFFGGPVDALPVEVEARHREKDL